jgi:HD-GYP domain-containing protein (c-di-GMP phosphodiesterase class II)
MYADMVGLVEDVFEKVRNGVGYNKNTILDSVDGLIDEIRKDKNRAIAECVVEHEGYYLYTLAVSVTILSLVTGMSLNYGDHRLIPLGTGALLHDIGMVRVPTFITEKKGALTEDEYNRIKTHPIYGYRIITKELDMTNEIATVALQHHEAFDGSGYPRKTREKDISEFARITSICDAFVAMTRERSYREEHLSYHAMKNILSESNRKYDPAIVKVFLSNMAIYPVGSVVELNNGVIGKVISATPALPLRPKIQVLIDEFGERVGEETVLDLQTIDNLFIKRPLSKSYVKQILNE